MCGIAGHVGPTARELLPAMLGLLKHRGPDDSGIHTADDVGLGMTRLAIIDLVTGQQPMSDPTGRYWIVFNGEIYNFRQLRAELVAGGRRFRTRSDTEVILHAYVAYGEGCVERLSGMFAFAIWDGAERRLFLARDRLGKKPLYYWHRGRLFLFASEPKALLCHPAVARALDWSAFHHYLAIRRRSSTGASRRGTTGGSRRRPRPRGRDPGPRRAARPPPRPPRRCARDCARRYGCASKATCRSACSCRAASTRAPWSPACAR